MSAGTDAIKQEGGSEVHGTPPHSRVTARRTTTEGPEPRAHTGKRQSRQTHVGANKLHEFVLDLELCPSFNVGNNISQATHVALLVAGLAVVAAEGVEVSPHGSEPLAQVAEDLDGDAVRARRQADDFAHNGGGGVFGFLCEVDEALHLGLAEGSEVAGCLGHFEKANGVGLGI